MSDIPEIIERLRNESMAEAATGCIGGGDYAKWASAQGYSHCLVLDSTSSAGDWRFIVSSDQQLWYLMYQDNNYPRSGFTRSINLNECYEGTGDEVLEQISDE